MLSRRQVRKPDGSLSECQHCFPVYGGGLEVKGVQGILQVSLGVWLLSCLAGTSRC
jgi:hypothetical protein